MLRWPGIPLRHADRWVHVHRRARLAVVLPGPRCALDGVDPGTSSHPIIGWSLSCWTKYKLERKYHILKIKKLFEWQQNFSIQNVHAEETHSKNMYYASSNRWKRVEPSIRVHLGFLDVHSTRVRKCICHYVKAKFTFHISDFLFE
jgi:hypothetical protein